jgi:lysyl-tRNA synthetase class 2
MEQARSFFSERGVLEVETPVITRFGTTEIHLDQFVVSSHLDQHAYRLVTSPELAMKRMLAAGYGDIFQIGKVFRAGEQGSRHQPEFTMLEWYRTGFDMNDLMREVEQLFYTILPSELPNPSQTISYAQAFDHYVSLDPFSSGIEVLKKRFEQHAGIEAPVLDNEQDYLDLIMSHVIEPQFDQARLTFVTHYPAEQASLARISPDDPRVAERFEVFAGGMELANGFYELADADEQKARMQAENRERIETGKPEVQLDQKFLAALQHGLPECSGVAVGFDRLVMLATGKQTIQEVISFTFGSI